MSYQPPAVPPPGYDTSGTAKPHYGATGAQEPLLAQQYASGSQAPANEWSAEGNDDDIPEDFKASVHELALWAAELISL